MARRRRRHFRQAEMAALVRYGPEYSGLMELQRQAESNLSSGVRSARGNARGIIAAVDRARPEVQEVYNDAAAAQGVTAAQVASSVNALGPVADSIKAAAGVEAQAAGSRIAESRAASLDDLSTRRVGAREGQQFAVQTARRTFADEIGQVLRRKQDLQREVGAFTASTAGELREAAIDRRQTRQLKQLELAAGERKSLRTAGFDPDTGVPIPGGPLDRDADGKAGGKTGGSGGGTPLTKTQKAVAADKVAEAKGWAQRLASAGLDLDTAKKALSEGRDEVKEKREKVYDQVTKKVRLNPDGTPMTKVIPGRPGLPKIESALLLQAALEEVYLGGVSKATRAKLRRRGLRPRALDLTRQSGTGAKRPQTGTPSG